MAYPAAPGRRIAYDTDGSAAFYVETSGYNHAQLTAAEMVDLNDESTATTKAHPSSGEAYYGVMFPELRDIAGIFVAYKPGNFSYGNPTAVETSTDTTNGFDGTWTQQVADIADYETLGDYWRNNITAMSALGVRAVRVKFSYRNQGGGTIMALHLYGAIAAAATPDRIEILDPDNADAVFTGPIDFGDIPQDQNAVRQIKLRNKSATKTISGIQVAVEALTGEAATWYDLSLDGTTYQATVAIASLAPAATQLVYLRQNVDPAATPGPQTCRVEVAHTTVA